MFFPVCVCVSQLTLIKQRNGSNSASFPEMGQTFAVTVAETVTQHLFFVKVFVNC